MDTDEADTPDAQFEKRMSPLTAKLEEQVAESAKWEAEPWQHVKRLDDGA